MVFKSSLAIGVLADTHIPKRANDLPAKAYKYLENVDLIIHAGDIVSQSFLERLQRTTTVYAVQGNNDKGLALPEKLELEFGGVKFGVIHDSGPKNGRATRMKRTFPDVAAVIFGHSHIPLNLEEKGILLFNPGSPTDKRMQPRHTIGLLHVREGAVRGQIVEID